MNPFWLGYAAGVVTVLAIQIVGFVLLAVREAKRAKNPPPVKWDRDL